MTHEFDERYRQSQWDEAVDGESRPDIAPNPYLVGEISGLPPGTALDAGCGEGAEAVWLASRGWDVTAVDIAPIALQRAAARAAEQGVQAVTWVRADLTVWEPDRRFDLVTTHYAHPSTLQLAFYERLSRWVAPGGTLLIVGHLDTHQHDQEPGRQPPAEASVTAADITAQLDDAGWDVGTASHQTRTLTSPNGHMTRLSDVVVRATRR